MTFTIDVAALLPWPDKPEVIVVAFIGFSGDKRVFVAHSAPTTWAALEAIISVARAYCRVTAAARN